MEYFSAFLLGFLGSLHCAGMCGPLVLALPIGTGGWGRTITGRVLQNTGRVVTYTIMGAIAGAVGRTVALSGLQQYVSIGAGLLMIVAYALPSMAAPVLRRLSFLEAAGGFVQRRFATLLQHRTFSTMFGLGLVHGLLPCGLVYAALAGSVVSGSPVAGAIFAAVFGLGTFPMMLVMSLIGRSIPSALRQRLVRLVPVAMIVLGGLFILRGLNLGIPMISPFMDASAGMDHHHH